MKKALNIILVLLIIAAIVITVIIALEYIRRIKNEDKLADTVSKVEDLKDEEVTEGKIITLDGYSVLGIIEIPAINLRYPIIEDTDGKAMDISIIKFWGGNINEIGNYSVAGHNYKNGTMFGKTKHLKTGDLIKMTDLNHNTVEYEVFKIYNVEPNDVTCLESVDENAREVTLITCTNGRKERLITKAREITEEKQ